MHTNTGGINSGFSSDRCAYQPNHNRAVDLYAGCCSNAYDHDYSNRTAATNAGLYPAAQRHAAGLHHTDAGADPDTHTHTHRATSSSYHHSNHHAGTHTNAIACERNARGKKREGITTHLQFVILSAAQDRSLGLDQRMNRKGRGPEMPPGSAGILPAPA